MTTRPASTLPWKTLLAILLAFLGLWVLWALSLTDSLDFGTPASPKEFARLCAKDTGANYCEMIHPHFFGESGPLSVIFPHEYGRSEFNERLYGDLARYERSQPVSSYSSAEALFRANAFALPELTTGTHQTLDGRPHEVVCQGPEQCTVDGLQVSSSRAARDGRAYFASSYLPLTE